MIVAAGEKDLDISYCAGVNWTMLVVEAGSRFDALYSALIDAGGVLVVAEGLW